MMLTEQTIILATADGRRAAIRYAIGAVLVLLLFVALLVVFGRAISLPSEPSLSATLDIVLGILLLILAFGIRYVRGLPGRHRDDGSDPESRAGHPTVNREGALGFGVFSMATNFTTLALMIPAAKIIAASGEILPERAALVAVLVFLAAIPAWLPVVLVGLAPGPAESALKAIGGFIERRGRLLIVGAVAALGAFLVIRGVVEAAGL